MKNNSKGFSKQAETIPQVEEYVFYIDKYLDSLPKGLHELGVGLIRGIFQFKVVPTKELKNLNAIFKKLSAKKMLKTDLMFLIACWENLADKKNIDFEINNLKVHNQTTLKDLSNYYNSITRASNLLKKTNFERTLYGDIFLVENLKSGEDFGWYYEKHDQIWLEVEKVKDIMHNLLHEIGHRYFKLFATNNQKKQWAEYFKKLRFAKIDSSSLPKIGDSIYDLYKLSIPNFQPYQDFVVDIIGEGENTYYKIKQPKSTREFYFQQKELYPYLNFPTSYSQKNSEEFFCETLAQYFKGLLKNKTIKKEFENIWLQTV